LEHAKFTKKADVFAAGIIFLELIALTSPNTLFEVLWPRILEIPLPPALKDILRKSLAEAPQKRTGSFSELLRILRSNEENVVGELIDDEDFSIDVSPVEGNYVASVLASDASRSVRRIMSRKDVTSVLAVDDSRSIRQ
jgi:serine/threonine protein kinase